MTISREKDFIESHGTCGLNKASNVMKCLENILKFKYISVDELAFHVTAKDEYLSGWSQ